MNNNYTISVTFTRHLGDDEEFARERDPDLKRGLVKQFVAELQQRSYDDCGMAGSFQVETITLNGETFTIEDLGMERVG